MMKRTLLAAAAAATLTPSMLWAHDAGGIAHMHPHGGEIALAIATLVVSVVLWRKRRS